MNAILENQAHILQPLPTSLTALCSPNGPARKRIRRGPWRGRLRPRASPQQAPAPRIAQQASCTHSTAQHAGSLALVLQGGGPSQTSTLVGSTTITIPPVHFALCGWRWVCSLSVPAQVRPRGKSLQDTGAPAVEHHRPQIRRTICYSRYSSLQPCRGVKLSFGWSVLQSCHESLHHILCQQALALSRKEEKQRQRGTLP